MKINHVIKTLVFSDFLLNAGLGVFSPIFAVFITKQIQGGTLEVVGFAVAITQIVKVSLEIPIARYRESYATAISAICRFPSGQSATPRLF